MNGAWRDVGGGCCHELILRFHPDLAPLAALHLSDIDGAPMYDVGNGYYWLAGAMGGLCEDYHGGGGRSKTGKSQEDCLRIFAEHVRLPIDEISALVSKWAGELQESGYSAYELGKFKAEVFPAWIEAQKPRWKAEAEHVIKLFDLKITGDKWPGKNS
jgi:hypothetical protein